MNDRSAGPGSRDVVSWVVAVLLSCAALVGVVSIVAVVVWAIGDVPGWVTVALGGGLAAGTAVFAWVIARALRVKQ